jgi:hypothetical protein
MLRLVALIYGGHSPGLQRGALRVALEKRRNKMRYIHAACLAIALGPAAVAAQSINFGDDASQWSNDGECDDRRFRGTNMAKGLDRDDIGHDATDCKRGYELGQLLVWDFAEAKAATQCDNINFGDDSSEWPNDGQCDDYRFEGPGADHVQLVEDIGRDASDCRRLCEFGQVAIRDY